MKQQFLIALPLLGAVVARPTARVAKRSVPREHAHEDILQSVDALLQLNNPDNIQASVFGLLGAAAGIEGAGDIADADCLQQATADQAFSNAIEAGDIDGATDALIFRTLERNTIQVGLESVLCESIQAVNPEIAILQQHQDAAAEGAQELNAQIVAELARQIASIGGDPLRALESGTFAPGELDDPTANGGGCNDAEDLDGCINTLGLRVDDLSEDEILAAVADVDADANADNEDANADDEDANADDEDANADDEDANADDANADDEDANADDANADNEDANADDANADDEGDAGLGGCNAGIVFGAPSDGRQEDAFEPADLSLFSHGSALNINVISNFICTQISNKCSVGNAVLANCDAAAQAANGLAGQAAADAFNQLLGF